MKNVLGIYVPSTNEVLYSTSTHDFRTSEDGTVAVDGGLDYFKVAVIKERKDNNTPAYIPIKIKAKQLLRFILNMDFQYGNRNIRQEYIDGYHGRFKISQNSNLAFYKNLIKNYEDIAPYIESR